MPQKRYLSPWLLTNPHARQNASMKPLIPSSSSARYLRGRSFSGSIQRAMTQTTSTRDGRPCSRRLTQHAKRRSMPSSRRKSRRCTYFIGTAPCDWLINPPHLKRSGALKRSPSRRFLPSLSIATPNRGRPSTSPKPSLTSFLLRPMTLGT